MKTAIDWANKPAPWSWIGPAFAAEVQQICGREAAPAPEKMPDIVGIQLRAKMIRAKMNASILADRVGCSRATIAGLIAGTTSASPGLWHRIDEALEAGAERLGRR